MAPLSRPTPARKPSSTAARLPANLSSPTIPASKLPRSAAPPAYAPLATPPTIQIRAPRGQQGFGYDPLFFVPELGRSTAELPPEEKARISHRGAAFRKFVLWYRASYQVP